MRLRMGSLDTGKIPKSNVMFDFDTFSQKNTREYIKEANKTSLSWLINMNKGDLAKCYGIIAKEAKELGYDSLSWCSFAQQITKEFC